MKYVLKKDVAAIVAALGSADLIRWIVKADAEMTTEPFEENGQKFYDFNVRDDQGGSVFSMRLPVTDQFFIRAEDKG